MKVLLFELIRPPFDIGVSILSSGKLWRLAIGFIDIEYSYEDKTLVAGIGIPFVIAYGFRLTFEK